MLKEFVEKIQALSDWPKHIEIEGQSYINGNLKLIVPPALPVFQLMTLSGLVDLLAAAPDSFVREEWLVHVVSHERVVIEAKSDDAYGRRERFADCCLLDGEQFPCNRFLDREMFVIGLQSRFVENQDSKVLLKLTSSMSNDGAVLSEDDGVSQKVTTRQGVSLKDAQTVKPRWTLKPFRTFREIDQPASEFVLRLKGEPGTVPVCALYEADGGKWKLDAVLAIKAWLEAKALGLPVVA